jgi:CheY-like chemotaxis protein
MSDPKTILVVDDEVHISHVVSLKLQQAGLRVLTAGDGEEGYEVACRELPDLVVTDFQMPIMSGLELGCKLRETAATSEIPVLVVTARGRGGPVPHEHHGRYVQALQPPPPARESPRAARGRLGHPL